MADPIKQTTEADSIAALALQQRRPVEVVKLVGPSGSVVEVIAKPNGMNGSVDLVPAEGFVAPFRDQDSPRRRKGTAQLVDLDSFIEFVKRHAAADSALFLAPNREHPALTAVLDYHRKDGSPRFGQHRAAYSFPVSDEWKAWGNQDGEAMSQEAFAAWIEDHVLDLMDPVNCGEGAKAFAQKLCVPLASPSKLVELSRGLAIYAGFQVTRAVNLQTGEAQITFNEEHKDATGAPLVIPGAFVVAIPAFRGGDRFQLPVRLRYRVVQGSRQVVWSFELYQPEKIFDAALDDASSKATEDTGLPLFRGSPEQ